MPSSKFGSKFLGEERYQQYVEELTADGTIDGEKLSPEERKEGFKKRNDKIGFQDFVEKVLDKKQSATVSKGPTALPGGGGGGALVTQPKAAAGITKLDTSKIVPETAAGGGILEEILKIVTSIRDTLIEKNEFDVDQSKKDRQTAERTKRAKKEKGLESGIFKGLAKATEKVLAPVKGMFEKIFDFIKTVILGNIVMNILKWMGDEKNKGKIDNLIRFFKDFWPAIVGAYLLFGTKFGGLIRTIGGWAAKIIKFAVPKLLRFVTRNPKAAAALAVAGGVGMLGARILTGTEVGADEETPEGEQTPEQQQEADFRAAQTTATESLREAEAEEPAKMSKGGKVPGSGNKDTVPAMLTPGEFVMSKGAVAKYGVDTMRSMNAAGGGTGVPSLMPNGAFGYSSGGGPGIEPSEEPGGRNKEGTEKSSGGENFLTSFLGGMGGMFGQKGKKEKPSSEETPSGSSLTETQQKALRVLAKYESGAAGYDAVNQIGTAGGRGVKGFSGDIKKMPQHEGRSLTDFTIAEIKKLQYDDKTMSDDQWTEAGKLHAVGAYQFIGNTLPGVAQRAGIPDNAKFTPGVQDLMALQLMKERGISPWVGPSDKATPSERAIVEKARSEPIAYDPSMSTGGAVTASASGTALSSTSSSSGASRSVSSGSSSSGGSGPKFDYAQLRKDLGVKTASVSKSSRPSSTAAYTQMQQGQQQSPQKTEKSQSPGIPSFDAAAMSSSKKIKTLGITV